jgi:hypothetical protein
VSFGACSGCIPVSVVPEKLANISRPVRSGLGETTVREHSIPVMNEASSEARNSARFAISSGRPIRLSVTPSTQPAATASAACFGISSLLKSRVAMGPGLMVRGCRERKLQVIEVEYDAAVDGLVKRWNLRLIHRHVLRISEEQEGYGQHCHP